MKKARFFKKGLAMVLTFTMLAACFTGCGQQGNNEGGTPTPEPTSTVAPVNPEDLEGFSEAPSSAEKVAKGEIPTVENRLPAEADIMVETMDSIGIYTDEFVSTFNGTSSKWGYGSMTEEALFRFKDDGSGEIEPNIAKGYDVNEDSTVYTIYLREGMKWSDGEPFTADDCIFWYEEMLVPKTFGKSVYNCYKSVNENGETTNCRMEKVDDYTYKVIFEDPAPMFLQNQAIDAKWACAPAHYMKQYLPAYIGEEAAAKKAEEMGFSDTAAMLKELGYYYWHVVGRPTLRAWVAVNDPADADLFVMARNDYYWKVDAEGKQLPYIDQLKFMRISDESQSLLMVMDGTIDFTGANYQDIVMLKENEAKNNYKLVVWNTTDWADTTLQLNQACKDEKLRALFQDIRFREALSIAVDRDTYAGIVTDGFTEAKQACPPEGSLGYNTEWATKWTEYNPTRAQQLLEEIGLKKGADGFYTFADGSELTLNIITWDDHDKEGELLIKYFQEVGLRTTYKVVDRGLGDEMLAANDHEIMFFGAQTVSIALRADNYVPVKTNVPWYGSFGSWYNNGKTGEIEPSAAILELFAAYEKMKSSKTSEEFQAAALEIYKLHEDNMWLIGFAGAQQILYVMDKSVQNYQENAIYCDEYRMSGLTNFATVYKTK